MCVQYPLQQRRARPRTSDDENEGIGPAAGSAIIGQSFEGGSGHLLRKAVSQVQNLDDGFNGWAVWITFVSQLAKKIACCRLEALSVSGGQLLAPVRYRGCIFKVRLHQFPTLR